MFKRTIFILIISIISLNSFGADNYSEQKKWRDDSREELESVFNLIENNYAPLRLKKKTIGLNWEKTKDDFRERMNLVFERKDYFTLVAQLLAKLRDPHVRINIPAAQQFQQLPLQFAYIEGKTIISYINRHALREGLYPFQVGDEVVAMDGLTPNQLREKIKTIIDVGNEQSNLSLLTDYMTGRSEANMTSYIGKESKTVTITIKRGQRLQNYTIDWQLLGKLIFETKPLENFGVKNSGGEPISTGMIKPIFQLPKNFKKMEIPSYLKMIVSEPENFFVGTFERDGKRLGFIRISAYSPNNFSINRVLALRYFISQLEEDTEGLFIDQSFNGGGSPLVGDIIVSMLTTGDYNFKAAQAQYRPSLKILQGLNMLNSLIAPLQQSNLKEHNRMAPLASTAYYTVKDAYNNFEYLSEPIQLTHIAETLDIQVDDYLKKSWFSYWPDLSKQVYSKPITMLINERSLSAGDTIPAVLKDNDRVKLIGTQTMGAGGYVNNYIIESTNSFSINLTNALVIRPNGDFIENNGVRPDVSIRPTIADYKNNFANYFERLLKVSNL